MGILAPERKRTRPAAPPPPPPEPPRRGGASVWTFLTALLLVVTLAVGVVWLRGALPEISNPFATETVDRTSPAVLQSIRDIGEYRAASASYELLVDLEQDSGLPASILGERTLFVAVGSVDAGIDLAALGPDAVEVTPDGRGATITLPSAQVYEPRLDLERSYVYERNEGLLNRIGNVFSGSAAYEREVMVAAERRLDEAARANDDLTARAEENTATMLESLLRSLGFERVDVRFE